MIKNIVISGGGHTGLIFYGILKESNAMNFWKIENIETIYSTSIGSLIAVMLCLKYEWEIMDDYLLKRKWQTIFDINFNTLIETYENKGLFTMKVIEEIFCPLFNAMEINSDISFEEFYEKTKIELHIFTTELNAFKTVDLSYKTHPNWKILEAIYCSCSLPVLFTPFIKEDKCYIDGGVLLNYPLDPCLLNANICSDEIFGLKKENTNKKQQIEQNSTIFEFLISLFNNLFEKMLVDEKNIQQIKNEIIVTDDMTSIDKIMFVVSSMEERKKLIKKGQHLFHQFISENPENI
jgi:predicted patatin/cPLA2 family phospholipase